MAGLKINKRKDGRFVATFEMNGVVLWWTDPKDTEKECHELIAALLTAEPKQGAIPGTPLVKMKAEPSTRGRKRKGKPSAKNTNTNTAKR
jgi:hypothetical protein